MHYGVALVPEGLIEFIPEIKTLIGELNSLVAQGGDASGLSKEAKGSFDALPEEIQKQLLLDRDPHGNVQVSKIDTEKLLMSAVKKEMGKEFSAQSHFFGYEGRAGFPTHFDSHYCYALGYTATLLVDEGLTGYMTCVGNLTRPLEHWTIAGLPITMFMNIEKRKGKEKPVIQKALVDLEGKAFAFFAENREKWAKEDHYRFPGPIQFFGEAERIDGVPMTLQIEGK
jgi:pyrophosphate--fructose-6-phosphate 1-phosphotransferase